MEKKHGWSPIEVTGRHPYLYNTGTTFHLYWSQINTISNWAMFVDDFHLFADLWTIVIVGTPSQDVC